MQVNGGQAVEDLQKLATIKISTQDSYVVLLQGNSELMLGFYNVQWFPIVSWSFRSPRLSDLMDYYRFIEISIKECRSNGIDCKIHGLSIIGRNRWELNR